MTQNTLIYSLLLYSPIKHAHSSSSIPRSFPKPHPTCRVAPVLLTASRTSDRNTHNKKWTSQYFFLTLLPYRLPQSYVVSHTPVLQAFFISVSLDNSPAIERGELFLFFPKSKHVRNGCRIFIQPLFTENNECLVISVITALRRIERLYAGGSNVVDYALQDIQSARQMANLFHMMNNMF